MPFVLEKMRKTSGNRFVAFSVDSDFKPNLDADELAKVVADAVASHHKEAIESGNKADGSGRQRSLESGTQKSLADKGKRPNTRGLTDKKDFVETIKAIGSGSQKPVKLPKRNPRGVRAWKKLFKEVARQAKLKKRLESGRGSAFVQPHGRHQRWLKRELERGVEYFYSEGEVERVVGQALEGWIEAAIE